MTVCSRMVLTIVSCLLVAGCNPSGDQLVRKQGDAITVPGHDEEPPVTNLSATRFLDPSTNSILTRYGSTIRLFAARYDLDWRLVLAVMKTESSFNPGAVSQKGARGFMQIMPTTGREVGKILSLDVLSRPVDNIHGGVFYLRKLYGLFQGAEPTERMKLTLAAYNAGIGRIYDAQEVASYLREDPNQWDSIRDTLPLLSKRYYTLHESVWSGGQPQSGWFTGSDETIEYVGKVMRSYDEYRLMLN